MYGSTDYGDTWSDLEGIDWPQFLSNMDQSSIDEGAQIDVAPYPLPGDVAEDISQGQTNSYKPCARHSTHKDSSNAAFTTTSMALFQMPLMSRTNPPGSQSERDIQRQQPRFEHDLYTAQWIRGQGTERAGWCGFCSSFHKMKDSAFWYHMHYSHGVFVLSYHRKLAGVHPQTIRLLFGVS